MASLPEPFAADIDLLALLDGLPVGVAVVDLEGRVLALNTPLERLTGFSRAEVRGMPCRHVVRSGVCQRRCPREGGEDTDIVNRHRRRVPVRVSAVTVPSRTGEPLFSLHMVEDLSVQRELESRCREPAGRLVGKGPAMERILKLLPAMAAAEAPVFLIGETGTGKDAVAEAIHMLSSRAREPFVRVNCGPMPAQAMEAELFGRVADSGEVVAGAFQRAGAGTLYLSDMGELPEPQQIQLAAYLDDGLIRPAGGREPMRAQARLVASSPASPEDLAASGRLRQDLAYRLGALRLDLPPLRKRPEDIEFLLAHFLEIFSAKFKKTVRGFTPKARRLLLSHDYPGNVRELKNIVEFAVMVCPRQTIPPACLPAHLLERLAKA